jgi:AAA family ATP:ADP antiporter
LAVYGSFLVLILLEAATHAVQRGITQSAREMLFTAVGREDKYKAKAFIDTFIYRAGDVVGAQTEGAMGRLGMAMGGLVSVVLPLALVWVMLGLWLGRAQARRAALLASAASVRLDSDVTVRQTVEAGAESASPLTGSATTGQKTQSTVPESSFTA